jgi:predicted ATPase
MLKRYVLTGAPGSGKTELLRALRLRGHAVVEEAATDVIARQQTCGSDEPWLREDFVDLIVGLQRQRQNAPVSDTVEVQLYDRSPMCTLALARYLGRGLTPALTREVRRVLREHVYQRDVFLVRPLGFIEPTAARRISYADSLVFERVHEAVYREHAFRLVDVPAGSLADRVAIVEAQLAAAQP